MLKLKVKKMKHEHGAISIAFAFAVITLVFLMAVTSLSFIGNDTKGASNQLIKNKAFYAAEAGIDMALGLLKNEGNGLFTNLAIGEALVSSTIVGDSLLTVTATSNGITQSLQVKYQITGLLPDAFYYAVSSFNTVKKLQFKGSHSPYLNGEIFSYTGLFVKFESAWVLGAVTVNVEQGTLVDNKTSYSYTLDEFPVGTTPLAWPTLNTQYYDDYINNVGGYSNYGGSTITSDLNLSSFTDNVLYKDNTLTFDNGCTITGPGVIVTNKDIKIYNGVTIGPNIHIICANKLYLHSGSSVTGMGSILYASNKVEIKNSYTSTSGSIISPNDVSIDCDSDLADRGIMTGIIYSGDKAKLRHTRIHGSVVAGYITGEDFHCTHIDYNASYLPTIVPPGFTPSSPTVNVVNGTWRRL